MTAHRIIKSLVNRGNAVVGVGCYSAAMACQSNYSQIIKVGTDMEDPWLDYYYEIIKPMQGNPFVPKVYSFYHDEANEYFICQMEKLIAIKDIHGAKTTESAKEVTSAIKQLPLLDRIPFAIALLAQSRFNRLQASPVPISLKF